MNTEEARFLLSQTVCECHKKEFFYWENAIPESPLVIAKEGSSGVIYQIEIEVVWDDRKARIIRVMIGIDDGGLMSAFKPMADDFFISPDGPLENNK
jgi:hypothetical protein